ncbi:MAG: Ig-like domain-containing protein [Clostridia bacterium]
MRFISSIAASAAARVKSAESAKRIAAGGMSFCLVLSSFILNFTVVHADSVALSSEAITLYVGNLNSTTVLTAKVYPENVSDREIEWESSDPGVATVENGKVTAVSEGQAVISAISGDGEAAAECAVVVGKGVTAIAFEQEEITLYAEGAPMLLTPVITPSDATNKSLVWTSSDYDIVSVDSMGGITPRKEGTAVIGASSVEGKVTAACTVHVLPPLPEELIGSEIDISAQRAMKSGTFVNYLPISRTLDEMLNIQCGFYNVIFGSSASVASPADVAQYLNPQNYCEGDAKYQFLDLSVPNNMTAEDLNRYLKGKGILSEMGQAFIDAANENGISEAYLVAHACLETGNGSSQLARGVEHNGTVVYNMFGIGAFDGNALRGGAAYAYFQGWTSPEAAIKGGAAWIAKNYIYRSGSRQNTLYKMRWNPLSPGTHQYATDVGWAVKQSYTIAKIIGNSDCLQIFEIPAYSGTYTGYIPDLPDVQPPETLEEQQPEQTEPPAEEQPQPEQTEPEQTESEQVQAALPESAQSEEPAPPSDGENEQPESDSGDTADTDALSDELPDEKAEEE